jgi:hypothetical protein
MPNYGEYATVSDFRTTYQGSSASDTAQDTLILQYIRSVSREMEVGGRWYYPRIETVYFDVSADGQLDLDPHNVLAVTALANGDGTAIASTDYDLLPYSGSPYYALRLKPSTGLYFLGDDDGNYGRAIALTGVMGYSHDYASGWQLQASQTGILTDSGTSLAGLTSGELQAGQLLRLGSTNDFAYVSVASTTTATIVRSVNGSTGIAHGATDPIYVWTPGADLSMLCKRGVQAHLRLKDNPVGETVQVGSETFSMPKDVTAWIGKQIRELGYGRPY